MKNSRILGHMLSAFVVTWIVSGASASAQMPLLLDEILLSEYENRDTGTAVAVDGSGRWLKLWMAADGRAGRNAGLAELLEFDSADTLSRFDASTRLSAEDYRYPSTASPDAWIWVYDGDPLDRGAYKRELGSPKPERRRAGAAGLRSTPSVGRSTLSERSRPQPEQSGGGYVIEILIRTPRYVMNTMKSVYRSDNATMFVIGLVVFVIGLATFTDLMRSARQA